MVEKINFAFSPLSFRQMSEQLTFSADNTSAVVETVYRFVIISK